MSRTTAVWSWLAIVIGGGVCLALTAVSVKLNHTFGLSRGESDELRQLYGFAFASADVLKAGLPIAIGLAWRARHAALVMVGLALFILCTAASLAAGFGLMAQSRASLASTSEAKALSLGELRTQLAADRTRLTALGWSRPVAQIEGDLAAERQSKRWETTKECTEATAGDSRTFCANYERLKGELAAAGEAQDLRARIDTASARLAGLDLAAGLKPADPQVASLAAVSGVEPSRIEAALSILVAVLIEAVSEWGLFVVSEAARLMMREKGAATAEVLVSAAYPQPSIETPKSTEAAYEPEVSARRLRASARKVSRALKRKLSHGAARAASVPSAALVSASAMTLRDDVSDTCHPPPRDTLLMPGDDRLAAAAHDTSQVSLADSRRRPANDTLVAVNDDTQVSAGVLRLSADEGSVRDFLAARTKTESGARVQARPLYDAYVSWCRAHNRPVLTLTRFGRAITAAGVEKAASARVHYLDLSLVA
jgi:hypothetical protein